LSITLKNFGSVGGGDKRGKGKRRPGRAVIWEILERIIGKF